MKGEREAQGFATGPLYIRPAAQVDSEARIPATKLKSLCQSIVDVRRGQEEGNLAGNKTADPQVPPKHIPLNIFCLKDIQLLLLCFCLDADRGQEAN